MNNSTDAGPDGGEPILLERQDYWARLTINRPAVRNAANRATWRILGDKIAELGTDPDLRVLFLTGAGDKAFMAGADISEFPQVLESRANMEAYINAVSRACDQLEALDVPVIAEINGPAIGGGLELVCACDYRISVKGAKFAVPSADMGLGLAYADIARLVGILGTTRTRDLLIFGKMYDAAEALAVGLLNEVVAPEELFERSAQIGETVSKKAPLSIRSAKKVLLSIAHAREPYYEDAIESIYRAWESDEMSSRVAAKLKRD